METEILKLDAPYEYIYCNGSMGLHIATMIVYEAKVNEGGEYVLETHSHPIVKYRHRPGGTVWNRAELTDCSVLCREDNKHITMEQFDNYVTEALYAVQNGDVFDARPFHLYAKKGMLDQNGITIDWPQLSCEGGRRIPQIEFSIGIEIERNPKGSKFKYICRGLEMDDETRYRGGSSLPLLFEFNNKKDLKNLLETFMGTYYMLFVDHQFKIIYTCEESCEFADVINAVNMKEPKIREKNNDINV